MHQSRQTLVIVEGIAPHRVGHKARLARLDLDHGALVLVGIEKDMVALTHQAVEQPPKLP